jgi:hypothetical protein
MRPAFHLLHNQEHSRSISNFEILYDVPNQDLSAEEIGGQRGPTKPMGMFGTWKLPDSIPHVLPRSRRYAWLSLPYMLC